MLSFISRILLSCYGIIFLLFGTIFISLIFFKSRNKRVFELFTVVIREYLKIWKVDIESFIFRLNQIKGDTNGK